MFVSLVLFMILGYPVAFALAALGLIYGLIGIQLGLFAPTFLNALPSASSASCRTRRSSRSLLHLHGPDPRAVAHAEDLLDTMGQLFGPVRGASPMR